MASSAPASDASATSDGPVLNLVNKRLRALRKKLNRIAQMEESVSQGKTLNKEQEEVLRSKSAVLVLIDELEKLRQPLASAVAEEISLAVQQQSVSADDSAPKEREEASEEKAEKSDRALEDLLNLLYFGSLFDMQSDFAATMLTRTHERGCCLTYDYVTDDDTHLLGERDLDFISTLGGLVISRPVDSSLSHKDALQRCIQHAKQWLANSDQPIEANAGITYAGLRERLNKIMASEYFIITPEMKAPIEVAAGNYVPFKVPLPVGMPIQVESFAAQKDEETTSNQEPKTGEEQSGLAEDLQRGNVEPENHEEVIPSQQEGKLQTEMVQNHAEHRERQQVSRRGRGGGGRRGFSNVRGGRGRGSGAHQNGRGQYYDQPGNHYQRPHTCYRERGSRGSRYVYGGYNIDDSGVQGGHPAADVGVAS